MRILKKMNMDQLAEKMPIISEINQKEIVGGTVYVGTCGGRLGAIGSGTEIVVLTNDEACYYNNAQTAFNNGDSSFTITGIDSSITFDLNDYGESLENADNNVKLNVFEQYAATYCPGAVVELFDSGTSAAAGVSYSDSQDEWTLKVNPDQAFNFDENDLKAILKHEGLHMENPNDTEVTNIMNTYNTSEFSNSSADFKASQAVYLNNMWHEENPNDLRDLRDACTALGASYHLANQYE